MGPEEAKKEESLSSGSSPRSDDSRQGGDSVSSVSGQEEEGRVEEGKENSPRRNGLSSKYSPTSGDGGERIEEASREQQISGNIEYNSLTHGYDCRQCDFGSHDHDMMKEHVATDHMMEKADLQCKECMVTFTKPFNLKIHIRKHETSSQFLPCEYCEQVFKVPNKLIKHMEGVHSVCPTCGEKNSDKAGLGEHMELAHGEPKRAPSVLGQLTGLVKPRGVSPHNELDNRHAKMRKLDSLADHIRAKQLQATTVGTNHCNGNTDIKPGLSLGLDRRRKSEMGPIQGQRHQDSYSPFFRPGLEHLVNQLNKMHGQPPVIKSQNNNILSSLSKMSEFPHHWRRHIMDHSPPPPPHLVRSAQLTPPVSPPPTDHTSPTRPLLINNNIEPNEEEVGEECNETGLDLTVKKEPKSELKESVNGSGERDEERDDGEMYRQGRTHILPHSFPYMVPSLPFLTRMPIGPGPHPHPNTVNASFTEHLFKLANISRPPSMPPPPSGGPQDLSQPPGPTILGPPRPPGPPPHVFPVFPPGLQPLPASMFPQHPLPPGVSPRDTDRPVSPAHSHTPHSSVPNGLESKPFRCTFCPKEFGHLSSLESHVERLHTNESKHHCESCGKAFSSKSNLTAHKKIHSGERPFECLVCQKRFRQKAHLQKHETTHSSATPYQCPHCDKAFGHPSNLNTHIATHSDVRPYECIDCGKAYKDSASFKRHRLVHTGERPHGCDLCNEQFIDSKSVRRHRESVHPTALPGPEVEEEEEEEEYIEPGQEEEYRILEIEYRPGEDAEEDEEDEDGEGEDEGVTEEVVADEESGEEGGLEIAEVSADDSGISSSLDLTA